VEQFDRFIATFQPKRTDDLKPGAEAIIGKRLEWEASYVIDQEDGAEYAGQFACALLSEDPDVPGLFVWTPACDLVDIEPRPRAHATR
jgi:hypothetical protein